MIMKYYSDLPVYMSETWQPNFETYWQSIRDHAPVAVNLALRLKTRHQLTTNDSNVLVSLLILI
jgi:hypothetical protein